MDTTQNSTSQIKIRRPYKKPLIEIIALRPQETVLGGCKSTSLSDNFGTTDPLCYTSICLIETPI